MDVRRRMYVCRRVFFCQGLVFTMGGVEAVKVVNVLDGVLETKDRDGERALKMREKV